MKNALLTIVFTALVAAQNSINDIPPCSLTCLMSAVSGLGCEVTDFACSCQKADQLTPVITPCVQTSCTNIADQTKIVTVLSGICAAAGFPIEAPAPAVSSTAPHATSKAESLSSEAPVKTKSEYPEHPTATETASEYPASTHVTDDVPHLPSSHSDLVPLPSHVDTVIVSHPSPKPTSVPGVLPPYPTGTPAPSVPAPSGTGAPSTASSHLPEFTGAAAAIQVPMVAAGVFGLAAFVL